MKSKLSGRFWCALTLFSLMGQAAWVIENMYLNIFIYKMFNASAVQISNMVSASAITATLTTIFIGALSDRIGKRKLFVSGGYILWGISIFSFVFLRMDCLGAFIPLTASAMVSLVIVLDCIMTFLGSSANDAAFNAWITDSTDSSNRGIAEGINAMMPLVAILVVFGGFMSFDTAKSESWTFIFSVIGSLTIIVGVLGVFLIQEPVKVKSEYGYLKTVLYGFDLKTVKGNPILYIVLLGFIVFNISIQIFMPYLIIYYEITLKMHNYVLVLAPAIIVASIFTVFWGKLYDKKGFKFSCLISVAILAAGYVILYSFKSTALVFIGSLLMMCGYLSGMAVFGAMIRDNTPHRKSGALQGVRIFSQVFVPGIVGPAISSAVLSNAEKIIGNDGVQSFVPNANIFMVALLVALLLLFYLCIVNTKKPPMLQQLITPFECDLSNDEPWNDYPRPQLKRNSFISLNGVWSLEYTSKDKVDHIEKILVPFPPESRLSGIGDSFKNVDVYSYTRTFYIGKEFLSDRTIIHFGAADQIAKVYVNNNYVGEHHGGYTPFEFDVSEYILVGNNTVKVDIVDKLDVEYPYGKQRKKRGGMWYTPISGIWQTVWLESVPENYIRKIKISTKENRVCFFVEGGEDTKQVEFEDKVYEFCGNTFEFVVDSPEYWSPEDPKLYSFKLSSGSDCVDSYFALRDISICEKGDCKYISLNGKPYFFHGLLDQGYFSDGIYLPATSEGYKYDILTMKKLGFNMLRKHIKVEPDIFYYYCDLYGMIVFQDFVNSGVYNFVIDTALPTAFLKSGVTHYASKKRRTLFESTAKEIVDLLHNHPSVCYYTIFNEGWGQYEADKVFDKMKELDKSRIWDATSGWFNCRSSDVKSDHTYFKLIKIKSNHKRPIVLSEFGGYSYKIPENSFNLSDTYGYRFYDKKETFESDLKNLYLNEIVPAIKDGLNATVFTQLSDVEDETNGLVTYDRQVVKVSYKTMKEISDGVFDTFNNLYED